MSEEIKTDPPPAPRGDDGKFKKKEVIVEVEKIIEKLDDSSKAILEALDEQLKEKLGDEIYDDYKDYSLPERIKHMQTVIKSVERFEREKKKTIDKTKETKKDAPPASTDGKDKIKYVQSKTLADINSEREFQIDIKKGSGFLAASQKLRGKQ